MLLLGDFEQMLVLRMILDRPGVYLRETRQELMQKFSVYVCVSTICRTLKMIDCTRRAMHRVAQQRSDEERARFMANISLYNVSMLVWLDESGATKVWLLHARNTSMSPPPTRSRHSLLGYTDNIN